jgi:Fe-S cluster assembly ATPase SufC
VKSEIEAMNRLEVKNLSVEIHGKPILDGLDLTVEAGEVAEEGAVR